MASLKLRILFCVLLFAPFCLAASSSKNIFIMAGQSNMAGRGGVEKVDGIFKWDGVIPHESRSNPSVLRLNDHRQWEKASEPLHQGVDLKGKTVGVSSGMAFANELLAKAGSCAGVVGLVPCAKGGSSMSSWRKGSLFYKQLISRIKASEKKGGKVRALFWLQGETDAANETTAAAYQHKLKRFFLDVRHDIKPVFLPIIVVKIATYDTYIPHESHDMEKVRAAQEAMHQELPNVQVIDALKLVQSDGKGYNKDGVHLSLRTEIAVGKLLAETYLSHYGKLL